jgi:DNA-binding transcriptional ArsR family regulator
MRNSEPELLASLKALASPVRLAILEHLKRPRQNFPAQVDGDPDEDGICGDFIRKRLGIAAATASRHLSILVVAGLLVATRKKGWTYYRRHEGAIRGFTDHLSSAL